MSVENQNTEDQQQNGAESQNAEVQEQKNKYLYLYAEFENYKKRALKERSDYLKFGHEGFVRELLTVSDNLGRALEHAENHEALIAGLKIVDQQFRDTLTKFGVVPITSIGMTFDPQVQEAVGQEISSDEKITNGQVIREHQKGYTLHGRLLRPARVVLAQKKES